MGFFDPFGGAADVGELKSDLSSVKSDIKTHTNNNDIHVTASDKSNWNSKLDKNQGSENSGKILGTNANGEVIPLNGYGFEYDEETKMLKYGTDPTSNLNQGIGLDDTLSKRGYAADAGAVGELKEDLDDIKNLKERKKSIPWSQGKIDSTGNEDDTESISIKTKLFTYSTLLEGNKIISVKRGMILYPRIYSENRYVCGGNQIESDFYVSDLTKESSYNKDIWKSFSAILSNGNFNIRFMQRKSDNSNISPIEGSIIYGTDGYPLLYKIEETSEEVESLKSELSNFYKEKYCEFEQGTIKSTGVYEDSTCMLRSTEFVRYTDLQQYNRQIDLQDGFILRVRLYDGQKEFVAGGEDITHTVDIEYLVSQELWGSRWKVAKPTIESGNYYFKFTYGTADGSTFSESDSWLLLKIGLSNITNNVIGYGAKGDGVSDDTEALNDFIVNNRVAYLPCGTYLVSGTIVIPDGTKLYGDGKGTIIKLANSFELTPYPWRTSDKRPILKVGSNCKISDIMIHGDRTKAKDENQVGVLLCGDNTICENVHTLDINYFPDSFLGEQKGYGSAETPSYGIGVLDADNISIIGCSCVGNGYEGIGTENANKILIDGCFIGDGIRTGIQVHRYCHNIIINNCIVDNKNTLKHADITIHGTKDDVIKDITIENCHLVSPCETKASIQTVWGNEDNIIVNGCIINSLTRAFLGTETIQRTQLGLIFTNNIVKSQGKGIEYKGDKVIISNNKFDCVSDIAVITGENKIVNNNLIN